MVPRGLTSAQSALTALLDAHMLRTGSRTSLPPHAALLRRGWQGQEHGAGGELWKAAWKLLALTEACAPQSGGGVLPLDARSIHVEPTDVAADVATAKLPPEPTERV